MWYLLSQREVRLLPGGLVLADAGRPKTVRSLFDIVKADAPARLAKLVRV
jgi:hypothetical protein